MDHRAVLAAGAVGSALTWKDVAMTDGTADLVHWAPLAFEGHLINVILINGTPWFRADQLAEVLDIRARDIMSGLDEDEKVRATVAEMLLDLVSEPGLYSTILRSRKPDAKRFKRWVTHAVLPAIRGTGGYRLKDAPDLPVPRTLPEALRAYAEEVEAHERSRELLAAAKTVLDEAQPKVEGYERLVETEGHFSLATAAQMLDTGRQRLIFELAKYGAIINKPGHSDHLRPYQQHVKAGRFVVKTQEVQIEHRDGSKETIVKGTTLVTPKGLDWVRAKRRDGGGDVLTRAAASLAETPRDRLDPGTPPLLVDSRVLGPIKPGEVRIRRLDANGQPTGETVTGRGEVRVTLQ